MIFKETFIKGLFVIEPELIKDTRGYFTRIYCRNEFKEHGIDFPIGQMNRSASKKKGTIRGLHYQNEPYDEDKYTQCIQGTIFDVALDLRKKSKTFGKWFGIELSAENMKMLFIPKGFAHGNQTLVNNTIIQYPASQFYTPGYEGGFRWDDPYLKINWPLKEYIVSNKDKGWPMFKV